MGKKYAIQNWPLILYGVHEWAPTCVLYQLVESEIAEYQFEKRFEILNVSTTLVGSMSNEVKRKGKCKDAVHLCTP